MSQVKAKSKFHQDLVDWAQREFVMDSSNHIFESKPPMKAELLQAWKSTYTKRTFAENSLYKSYKKWVKSNKLDHIRESNAFRATLTNKINKNRVQKALYK
eukprot:57254_1